MAKPTKPARLTMGFGPNGAWHHRHPDFQTYDRVTIDLVPRFKTSGLSGDEWRTSARVLLFFKGEKVHETHYNDVDTALRLLHANLPEAIPERVIELETIERRCDQPGCAKPSTATFRVRKEFTADGRALAADGRDYALVRWFCADHAERGNAGREDNDRNYELIEPPLPREERKAKKARRRNA